MRARHFALVAVLLGAAGPLAAQPAGLLIRAQRAVTPPAIDGVLDDAAWQQPPLPAGEWRSYNPLHGDQVPQRTTVWAAYDAESLYFAFRCDDPDPGGIKTSITRRDNIWQDDWIGVSLPGTVLYAGYGSLFERRTYEAGRWTPGEGPFGASRRGLFLKASYLYRL